MSDVVEKDIRQIGEHTGSWQVTNRQSETEKQHTIMNKGSAPAE